MLELFGELVRVSSAEKDRLMTTVTYPDSLEMAKKPADKRPAKRKGQTWLERRDYLKNVSLARDLGDWLNKITSNESKLLPEGRLTIAELVDAQLREWAWQRVRPLLEKELGIELGEDPPPPPVQFATRAASGGWTPPRSQ
jgi:hypothetical protein